MRIFKTEQPPSCSTCKYATVYIPHFTFPFNDPFCAKGHGQCKCDKLCGDYRVIGSHYCCECKYWVDGCCYHHNSVRDKFDDACVYFEVKE